MSMDICRVNKRVVARRCHLLISYSVSDDWMTLEHWWKDTDREQPKPTDRNLSQCHLVRHKSQTDCWAPCVRIADRPRQLCQGQSVNKETVSFSRKRKGNLVHVSLGHSKFVVLKVQRSIFDTGQCMTLPEHVSSEQVCGLPLTAITVRFLSCF
jgi:hypothetical protein